MNKTPILSLLFALLTISVANPLLTSCDDDDESKVYILEKEIEAGLLADNSIVIDTTCVTATIQGKMLQDKKLNDMFNLSDAQIGIQYVKADDFLENANEHIYWNTQFSEEATFSDFKIQLRYLEPSTNYFYRVYCTAGSTALLGAVKQFTTQSLDNYLSLEVVEQDFRSMKFAGINRLDDILGEIKENGIMMRYYESDYFHEDVYLTKKGDSIFLSLTDILSAAHTYNYYLIAYGGGMSVRTTMKTFSTRNPGDYIYLNEPEITSTSAVISGLVDSLIFTNYNSDYNMNLNDNITSVDYGTDKNNLWDWSYCWTKNPNFRLTLTYLKPKTTYYYKVGATFQNTYYGSYFTEIRSFTTK